MSALDGHRGEAALESLSKPAREGLLYAILDACNTPSVPELAQELGPERATSLYSGSADERYWSFAPYLMRVDEPLLRTIAETLWSETWGVFLVSANEWESIRRHLKSLLVVQSPQKERWYFRFYDPRVLEVFLPTCTAEQLQQMFGPVAAYGIRASRP